MSSIGNKLKITVFGESHGNGIGFTLDSLPAGYEIDMDAILVQMARRAPGGGEYATPRKEPDFPEVLSGIYNNKTNGFPLCAVIKNTNTHSSDYNNLKTVPRPGHADYTAYVKYNGNADMRGGGHFSGRLTAPLVFAGAVCRQILEKHGIYIAAHVNSIGNVFDSPLDTVSPDLNLIKKLSVTTFPVIDEDAKQQMIKSITLAKSEGDSLGGVVELIILGMPIGIGGALFDGIESKLASYIYGIPAVKGVEFGAGFEAARMKGSQNNDPFIINEDKIATKTNNSGGILGGISNGMPIVLRAAFKPTSSITKAQQSVDLSTNEPAELIVHGRHDPCVVPRAVPCVEAAAALAITDMLIESGAIK